MADLSYRDLGFDPLLSRENLNFQSLPDLPEGTAYNGTTNLVADSVAPSDFLSGEFVQHLINAKDGHIRSADCLAYNDGTGYFLGWDPTLEQYVFFIGSSAGNKLTWDGTTLSVSGAFSAGTIDIGGSDASSFHVDVNGNLWLGAATFATAPFTVSNAGAVGATSGVIGGLTLGASTLTAISGGNTTIFSSGATAFTAGPTGSPTFTVTQAGALTATGVTLTGAITATSGAIGGWVVTATAIKDAAGIVGMSSAVTGGDDIRFWAGHATPASAPFYVTESGVLVATSATISGSITASSGTIGGFSIGSDYLRDAADSFGLASTVSVGDDVRFWAGATFANRATAPARITEAGAATFTSISITGGVIDGTSTIGGRDGSDLAAAIDASANLVTDIVNARINSSAKTILSDFNFGAVDYAGGVKSGDITWNTTTGAITGGSGVVVYRNGIVGASAGVATFSIDATTGDATFAGTLSAPDGNIGGWVIGAATLADAAGVVGMSSLVTGGDDIRFWAGHVTPASAPFYVTEAGVLVATSATISGAITATSGTFGGFTIGADYLRDAANSFGLASTVTAGDDVRFWAGDTFANRATAPARITEAGNATFATITATGTINATAGYVGTATALAIEANGYNFGATGAIRGGATAYNTGTGWWLGYDTAAYKFFIGAAAGNKLTWDGTTLAITGTLTATLGTIGGFTIGATTLSAASGGNTTILSSGATAFSAGPTGSPTVTITQAGVFTGVGVNISNVTFNSIALTTSGAEILRGYNLFPNFDVDSQNGPSIPYPTAFSDATTKIMSFGVITFGTAHDANVLGYSVSGDVGSAFYLSLDSGRIANGAASTSSKIGCIVIGTDYWICDSGNNKIYKNGSEETISGTIQQGPLGHDPTNSYLLVLYSTTKIARFSGIAGATITNIASDITLDTAITRTVGFLYDNTNSRYICVDTTNNLLRRFNSAGATIDTVAYTVGDTYLNGLAIFNGRVHLVTSHSVDVDTRSCYGFVDIIPTSMLI